MADETATNPVEGGDTSTDTAPETQEVEQQQIEPELDEFGQPVAPEPEDEEVELEDLKLKVPKDQAQKVKDGFLRQADYTRKTQELADQRKAFEAERSTAQQASDAEINARAQVVALDQQLATYLKVDWAAEMNAARANYDQDRLEMLQVEYARFNQLKDARANAAGQFVHLTQQRHLAAQQDIAKRTQDTAATLARDIPGWSEETKARLSDFGMKKYGFSADEVADISIDPRIAKVLNDAFQADQAAKKTQAAQRHVDAQQAQPAAKVGRASAPPQGLDDRVNTDEWMRRRNEQARRRA